jgi:hypothetical protein
LSYGVRANVDPLASFCEPSSRAAQGLIEYLQWLPGGWGIALNVVNPPPCFALEEEGQSAAMATSLAQAQILNMPTPNNA